MKTSKILKLLSISTMAAAGLVAVGSNLVKKDVKAASASSDQTYILVGSMESWNNNSSTYTFTWNGTKSQYELKDVALAVNDTFRITKKGQWIDWAGWNQCKDTTNFTSAGSDNNIKCKNAGRYNFYFKDWEDGSGNWNPIYVSKASYTVTLNKDGGSIASGNDLTGYTYGDTKTLPTLAKSGYDFDGWYDNSGLTGSPVTGISNTDHGNKEFWAKFTEVVNTYTVKLFNEDGSSIETFTDVTHGSNVTPTAGNPTKAGSGNKAYTFAGWVDDQGQSVSLNNIQGDLEAYASFTEDWKLGYYLVGHYGSVNSFTVISDNTIKLEDHTNGELKAVNVSFARDDTFKIAKYIGGGAFEEGKWNGYSQIDPNCSGYSWFENSDTNAKVKAAGHYSLYFKEAKYYSNYTISAVSDGNSAGQLAYKLHTYDPYIASEESEVPGGKGYCVNDDRWGSISTFYNGMSADEKAAFMDYGNLESGYEREAYDRYQAWAARNSAVTNSIAVNGLFGNGDSTSSTWIILVVSLVGLTAVGGFVFYKKRKENF